MPESADTPGRRGRFWRESDIVSFFDHYGRDTERWHMHVELVRLWIDNFGLFAADKDVRGKPLGLDVVARSLALSAWHIVADTAVPLQVRVGVVTLLTPIDWSIAMAGRKLTPAEMRTFTAPSRAIHELHAEY